MLSVNSPPRVCYCALVSFWHFFIPVGQFLILLGQLPTPSSLFLVWGRLWDTQTWIVYYLRRPLTCGSVLIFEPPISRGKPGCRSACRMAPTTPPGWPRGAGGLRPVALCPCAGWGSTGGWPRRGAVENMGGMMGWAGPNRTTGRLLFCLLDGQLATLPLMMSIHWVQAAGTCKTKKYAVLVARWGFLHCCFSLVSFSHLFWDGKTDID